MKKFILINLLFLFSTVSFAAELTVTSSADSGAGSLRDIIDNVAVSDDSIIFAAAVSSITLTSGDIDVDLNISIDGGGNVEIDGNANSRIFDIQGANTLTVLIENLIFKNGSESEDDGGGAIFIYDERVNISNCVFTGNSYARNWGNRGGGAIYNREGFLNIVNSTITNNSASGAGGDGGGIYAGRNANAEVFVDNCVIKNNSAVGSGGGIYSQNGFLSVTNNTKFSDNQATDDGGGLCINSANVTFFIDEKITFYNNSASDNGGAFYSLGNLEVIITNCNFFGNNAEDFGGAICGNNSTSLKIYNSTFTNNFSNSDDGGAVYYNLQTSTGTFFECDFINNSAVDNGGALFFSGNIFVTNCNFFGNNAEDVGGAISANNSTKIHAFNSAFTNNFSNSDSGGAIHCNFASSTGLISNCEFKNNISPAYGGAIFHNGFMKIEDSKFYSNSATNRAGAAYIRRANILNTYFTNNITVRVNNDGGGALYTFGDSTVSNCNFFDNSANANAGAFRINSATAKVNVFDCKFKNNSARTRAGGAIQAAEAVDLKIKNSTFLNNFATTDGGAVGAYQNYMSIFITNSVFENNSAGDDAGALYISGTSSVINCSFTKSSATDNGGAIACFANLSVGEIIGCNFQTNSAIDRGGAAYIQGNWTIENSTVISNSATISGGGFYFGGAGVSTINVYNCDLFLNSAGDDGGGIFANCVLTSTNCIIDSNVCGDNGGGIDFEQKFTLKNSKIINNYAPDLGGGIYNYAPNAAFTSLISNCSISTNIANNGSGGGIYQNSSAIIFDSSIISSNYSGYYGGGIFANANDRAISIFTNCSVRNNYSVEDGGGIRNEGFLLVYGSCFSYNISQNDDGGAIYKRFRSAKIINSTISANSSADNGGGIYLSGNGRLDIFNSTVANNSSLNSGLYKDDGSSGNNIMNVYSTISSGNSVFDIAGNLNIISNCLYQTVGAGTWTTAANNIIADPNLKPLANYGGSTKTHGFLNTSPAVNQGINPLNLVYDQRGPFFERVYAGIIDIGAFESITPYINITNLTFGYTFPFKITHTDIAGISSGTVGNIWYSNKWSAGTSSKSFPASLNWTTNFYMPQYGNYEMTVYGTNALGSITNDTIKINRKRSQIFIFD